MVINTILRVLPLMLENRCFALVNSMAVDMCSYKVLFHKASGYVVKCSSCSSYQIAFGTMVFTISTEQIALLFEQVAQFEKKSVRMQGNPRERFQVKLPCESVIMALNMGELKQFYGMLEEAFVVEELKRVLAENNIR